VAAGVDEQLRTARRVHAHGQLPVLVAGKLVGAHCGDGSGYRERLLHCELARSAARQDLNAVAATRRGREGRSVGADEVACRQKIRTDVDFHQVRLREIWRRVLPARHGPKTRLALRREGIVIAVMNRDQSASRRGQTDGQIGDCVAVQIGRCHGKRRSASRHRLEGMGRPLVRDIELARRGQRKAWGSSLGVDLLGAAGQLPGPENQHRQEERQVTAVAVFPANAPEFL